MVTDEAERDLTVIPNAKLIGRISGVARQIDVLVDTRFDEDASRRMIVDAKMHRRPIDVKQVEEFESMMKDVAAHRGILICPNGHTAAALRRAQEAISIRLVSLAELEQFDLAAWDRCSRYSCHGFVLWDSTPALRINGACSVFATAKCDECSRFNVWCWGCGNKFSLQDEDEYQCSCRGPWFWLTAVEDDAEKNGEEELRAVYLLLIFGGGQYATIDRRPLL